MTERLRHRGGYAMMEALAVLVLTLIVGALLCTTLATQSRIARSVGERIAYNDATRAIFHIVPEELRYGVPDQDIRAASPDSVAARWVRGTGVVCAQQGTDIWLRMRTMRDPDTDKDSLLAVSAAGERAITLTGMTKDQMHCPAASGEEVYRLRVGGAMVDSAAFAIVFESGTYYLSQRALRYRLGAEGRQPLTEEYLRDGASSFSLTPSVNAAPARFAITIALKTGMQETSGRTQMIVFNFANGRRVP